MTAVTPYHHPRCSKSRAALTGRLAAVGRPPETVLELLA